MVCSLYIWYFSYNESLNIKQSEWQNADHLFQNGIKEITKREIIIFCCRESGSVPEIVQAPISKPSAA